MARSAISPRVLVVADPRPASPGRAVASIRRYRLARVRFDGRASEPSARFAHIKRIFD